LADSLQIVLLANRPKPEIAQDPELIAANHGQAVGSIGSRQSGELAAAGELLLHKGSATQDAAIGEITYSAARLSNVDA
jgi:hypothetical protein